MPPLRRITHRVKGGWAVCHRTGGPWLRPASESEPGDLGGELVRVHVAAGKLKREIPAIRPRVDRDGRRVELIGGPAERLEGTP